MLIGTESKPLLFALDGAVERFASSLHRPRGLVDLQKQWQARSIRDMAVSMSIGPEVQKYTQRLMGSKR